jgi:Domain of unknown function (DUF5679)
MKKLLTIVGALAAAGAAAALFFRRGGADEPVAPPAPGPAPPPEPEKAPSPAQAPSKAASESPPGDGVEGYCVRERKKVRLADPRPTKTKNGRDAIRGKCPDCGAEIFRFGKA